MPPGGIQTHNMSWRAATGLRLRPRGHWDRLQHEMIRTCLFVQLCTVAVRLIVRSWLDFPTFATRRLHACHRARAPSGGRWNCRREMSGNFAEMPIPTPFRDLLHAAKVQHGTDGFTSPTKEGVVRIFFDLKIRRLRPGLNPRTWVLNLTNSAVTLK